MNGEMKKLRRNTPIEAGDFVNSEHGSPRTFVAVSKYCVGKTPSHPDFDGLQFGRLNWLCDWCKDSKRDPDTGDPCPLCCVPKPTCYSK